MSVSYVSVSLRRMVEDRALQRCEYCLLPSQVAFVPHEIDHIVAEKHGGTTESENLALCCWRCNRHKGSDPGSFDPQTGDFSFLYHPRTDSWRDHFKVQAAEIIGLTAQGRTTVNLLKINSQDRVAERQLLIEQGVTFG